MTEPVDGSDEIALVDYPYTDAAAFHREVADRIIDVWQARERRIVAGLERKRPAHLLTVAQMTERISRVYAGLVGRERPAGITPTVLWVVAVGDLGGVARHVLDTVREGIPGWRICVLCPEGPLAERLRELGAAVVTGAMSPTDPLPAALSTVRHTIRTLRPTIVHSHLAYSDFLVAGAATALSGRPAPKLVTTEHGIAGNDLIYHGTRWKSRVMEMAHAARLRRFDAVIAVADATLQAVRAKWYPSRRLKTIVIPNGVDSSAVLPAPQPGRFHVVSLSRLAPEKNLPGLIAAFKLVHDRHPEARLTIAGEGPLRTELENAVAGYGLGDSVSMPGHVDAAGVLTEADVLTQLSTWENCSYSLLDASVASLAVVTTNVGGNGQLLQTARRPRTPACTRRNRMRALKDRINRIRFIWLYGVWPGESLYAITDKSAVVVVNSPIRREMVKKYRRTKIGRQGFIREVAAEHLLGHCQWKMRVRRVGRRAIAMPLLPWEARLDRAAEYLSSAQRLQYAADILDMALEIYMRGFVHRDISARNVYVSDGAVVLNDFETWTPLRRAVPFLESYDVTGVGPEHVETRTGGAFGGPKFRHLRVDEVLGQNLTAIVEALSQRLNNSDSPSAERKLLALRGDFVFRPGLSPRRIAVAFQGDAEGRSTWSGTPHGIINGLRQCGHFAYGIRATPPAWIDRRLRQVLALFYWFRVPHERDNGWRSRLDCAVRIAGHGMLYAGLCTYFANRQLHAAPPVALIVQIGTGYRISRSDVVTYEDLTIDLALQNPRYGWQELPKRLVERRIASQKASYTGAAALCFATPWAAQSAIDQYQVSPDKVFSVGIGTAASSIYVGARAWAPPQFLFVGKEWEAKNGPLVLEAFSMVRKVHPDAVLHLVGIHELVTSAGVVDHGHLQLGVSRDQSKLRSLYANATCLVVPAKFEAAGIVFLEAAAAGLPSIGPSAGGAKYLIGDHGDTVDSGDADELAAVMLDYCSPDFAAQRAAAARSWARQFTWRRVGQRILAAGGVPCDCASDPILDPWLRPNTLLQ